MGGLILGVNTLYRFFCFFKLFLMVGNGLTLLKHISKVLKRQVVNLKLPICLSRPSSFSQASTIMGEAIRKIPAQTGMIDPRVVPFLYSVFKHSTGISSAVITRTLE